MNIDYNNLQDHIDMVVIDDRLSICDKNRDIQADVSTYEIDVVDADYNGADDIHILYCEYWAKTSNRSQVMEYFRNKY